MIALAGDIQCSHCVMRKARVTFFVAVEPIGLKIKLNRRIITFSAGQHKLMLFMPVLQKWIPLPAACTPKAFRRQKHSPMTPIHQGFGYMCRGKQAKLQPPTGNRSGVSACRQQPHIFKGDGHKSVQVRLPQSDSRFIGESRGVVSSACNCVSSSSGNRLRLCA